jgi:hypothetical protein
MRKALRIMSVLPVLAALVTGCVTTSPPDVQMARRAAVTRVPLAATSLNAGEIGFVTLIPQAGGTDFVLQVSGVPNWVTRPVHLYTSVHEGSCRALSPAPMYGASRVLASREMRGGFLTVRNATSVSMDALRASPHAIVVRSSPADAGWMLFCGDVQSA